LKKQAREVPNELGELVKWKAKEAIKERNVKEMARKNTQKNVREIAREKNIKEAAKEKGWGDNN
jgi:hypothetical protein